MSARRPKSYHGISGDEELEGVRAGRSAHANLTEFARGINERDDNSMAIMILKKREKDH